MQSSNPATQPVLFYQFSFTELAFPPYNLKLSVPILLDFFTDVVLKSNLANFCLANVFSLLFIVIILALLSSSLIFSLFPKLSLPLCCFCSYCLHAGFQLVITLCWATNVGEDFSELRPSLLHLKMLRCVDQPKTTTIIIQFWHQPWCSGWNLGSCTTSIQMMSW